MANIYSKLVAIQSKLNAPKNQENKFGGYKYRSCEDILEAVKPLLKENKLVLILSDDVCCVGDRIYVRATATLCDTEDENGLEISNTAFAREEETKKGMDASQITGASSSYARKYALNGLFCIDDNKDSDATNIGASSKTTKEEVVDDISFATQVQIAEILRLNCNIANVKRAFKVDKLEDLTEAQADQVIAKKKASMGANNEN